MKKKYKSKYYEAARTVANNLTALDIRERAILKRNAGETLSESRQGAMGIFFRVLPAGLADQIKDKAWEETAYFLIATLYPFDKTAQAFEDVETFGDSLRLARNKENEDGLNRRVSRLLDADSQQLPFQLRQAVLYLTNMQIPINWSQLLEDVLNWHQPNRNVQKSWARAYFKQS